MDSNMIQEDLANRAPGTVSRILWHFTGGPIWDQVLQKQSNRRKPPDTAYQCLLSILRSKQLILGSYKEKVKAEIPLLRLNEEEERRYRTEEILSSSVCCLADIPINHLSYMADRYGKFAIGFHRDSAISHGFNPVFYALHNAKALRHLMDGFGLLEGLDTEADAIEAKTKTLESTIQQATSALGHSVTMAPEKSISEIRFSSMVISGAITDSRRRLQDFLAFVKTFERTEFSTIFCEREWRAIKEYNFSFKDVAMVVVPRKEGSEGYYSKIIEEIRSNKLDVDHHVPIVPWEDLIEH